MTSLMSCCLSRKIEIVSDFCQNYKEFPDDLDNETFAYLEGNKQVLRDKEEQGVKLLPHEKFVKVTVNYAGENERTFREKCPK